MNKMRVFMIHSIPSFHLVGWGGLILFLYERNLLTLIQHPRYHVFSISVAFALVTAGIFRIFLNPSHAIKPFPAIVREIFLLSPVILFCLFPFDTKQVASRIPQEHRSFALPPTPEDSDLDWMHAEGVPSPNLVEVLLVCANPDKREKLSGKIISLIGQYTAGEKGYKISRLYMYCCAADMQTIMIPVKGNPPPNIQDGEWVQVVGKVHFLPPKDTLSLDQVSVKTIPEPKDIYLYYP